MTTYRIGKNIRALRKAAGLSQEELASALNVSFQSVSKWEREESIPDVPMLMTLANFFSVSTDSLLGMEEIRDEKRRRSVFCLAQAYMRDGNYTDAVKLLREEMAVFPADSGLMLELSKAMCLEGIQKDRTENIHRSISLCRQVLSSSNNDKLKHTARAALCFMYRHAGEIDQAKALAAELPHKWESREYVLPELLGERNTDDETLMKRLVFGLSDS